MRNVTPSTVNIELPIAELATGPIAPSIDPDHPSWRVLADWDDPLVPRACAWDLPPTKERIDTLHGPAILMATSERHNYGESGLVAGRAVWRDYAVEGRFRLLAETHPRSVNTPFSCHVGRLIPAEAGIAFREETTRKYYFFCLEGKKRLTLSRRIDDDWVVFAFQDVPYDGGIITLRVEVRGEAIHASCPELKVAFDVEDGAIPAGLAGFRSLGRSELFALRIMMTADDERTNAAAVASLHARTTRLSAGLPEAVPAGTIDLSRGRRLLGCSDFARDGVNDLLFVTPEGFVATTFTGEELWRHPKITGWLENISAKVEAQSGRRIYGFAGEGRPNAKTSSGGTVLSAANPPPAELIALDGKTGAILNRMALPTEIISERPWDWDFNTETGCARTPGQPHLVLRTDSSDGGCDLWAYDTDLRLLWQGRVNVPYGHHWAVRLVDINGDGRNEVLAAGTLFSATGKILWRHDRAADFKALSSREHYDAVLVQTLEDAQGRPPLVIFIGGNAGIYVVDGATGRTRRVYHSGHAQWAIPCRLNESDPRRQFLVGMRWRNMGILTLISAEGERLWDLQPDFKPWDCTAVQWVANGPQHIWIHRSAESMGLYDYEGRMVTPLEGIRRFMAHKPYAQHDLARVLRNQPDGQDILGIRAGETLALFAPSK